MYLDFFGFEREPFNLTPDSQFLFLSSRHREALAALLYGIEQRKGFIALTGEIGSGKTTICRALLKDLDRERVRIALILNPQLSDVELLQSINHEYGIAHASSSKRELLHDLNEFLLAENAKGHNCVLVIDESQRLSPDALEQVRLISNLETESAKLIQIALVGQPELDDLLHLPELEQLNQRVLVRFHIEPLSPEETQEYIDHRLAVAAPKVDVRFHKRAVRRIHDYARGIPRRINGACDRALLKAYAENTLEVTEKIADAAIAEVSARPRRRKRGVAGGEAGSSEQAAGSGETRGGGVGWAILGGCAIIALAMFAIQRSGGSGNRDAVRIASTLPAATDPVNTAEGGGATLRRPTPAPSATPSPTPTPSSTPTQSPTPTPSLTPTPTSKPSSTPSPAPTPGATPSPSHTAASPTPTATVEPSPTVAASPSAAPSPTPPPTADRPTPTPASGPFSYDANSVLRVTRPDFAYPACVMTWLALDGQRFPEAELARLRAERPDVVASLRLTTGAAPLHLREARLVANLSMLRPSLLPVLVQTARGKSELSPWVLVVERSQGKAVVLDPLVGRTEIDDESLAESLAGVVALYRDRDGITGLGKGSSGDGVRALQRHLERMRLLDGAPSGTFDAATETALKRYRDLKNLPGPGEVDAVLALALLRDAEAK